MTQETAAAPIVLVDANQFSITGPIVIGYSRSSFNGVPRLSYQDATLDLSFSGTELTQVDTGIQF